MLTLIINLRPAALRYKLFDMPADPVPPPTNSGRERVVATGRADLIGQPGSTWSLTASVPVTVPSSSPDKPAKLVNEPRQAEGQTNLPDHAAAIDLHLEQLVKIGALSAIDKIEAIGFQSLHGGPTPAPARVDEKVLATMEQFSDLAPLHNPLDLATMRALSKKLPGVPQVVAFETAFHQTIPPARQTYGVPHDWSEKLGIRRYGFHGASHRFIALRCAEKFPRAHKVISVHLGASSSICAIRDGRSVANTFGMTAQSGLLQPAGVGDLDPFALQRLLKSGLDLQTIWHKLAAEGGLLGISGVSADMRQIEAAAASGGDARAKLALAAFVDGCRHYIAAYLGVLDGADVIVFTAGIGQYAKAIRREIMSGFDYAGIKLSLQRNSDASGSDESLISDNASKAAIWVIPTNEELIVARQTTDVLRPAPTPPVPAPTGDL